jgi:hypothetical protein
LNFCQTGQCLNEEFKKNFLRAGLYPILGKMSKGNNCSVDLLLKYVEDNSLSLPEGFDVLMWV